MSAWSHIFDELVSEALDFNLKEETKVRYIVKLFEQLSDKGWDHYEESRYFLTPVVTKAYKKFLLDKQNKM